MQVGRGGETQVDCMTGRGKTLERVKGLMRLGKHWREGRANEGDAVQEWRKSRHGKELR